jgi:hypothetical protein
MATRNRKPKNLTDEQIIEKIEAYEALIFGTAWNSRAHLDTLIAGLTECRQELAFRGHVYRAI